MRGTQAGLLSPDHAPPPLDPVLARLDEPVLVCGHSHIPWQQEYDGRVAFNPGSVGLPVNGDARAQYALLAWQGTRWRVEHYAVPYDLERVRRVYQESGLLAEGGATARAFLLTMETGQAVVGRFFSHVYSLAKGIGCESSDVVPDEIWIHAIETFNWEASAWQAAT